jgi:hypothetical protein
MVFLTPNLSSSVKALLGGIVGGLICLATSAGAQHGLAADATV